MILMLTCTDAKGRVTSTELLYVEFHQLNGRILKVTMATVANPDLQVIGSGLGESPAEPRGSVKLAAGAGGTTPTTIPQGVISVELSTRTSRVTISRIAKVVIAEKGRVQGWPGVSLLLHGQTIEIHLT